MRLARCLLFASLNVVAFVAPAVAHAQSAPVSEAARAQARDSFHAGVDAYTRGEFPTALAAFQNAYRLAPAPAVRVNMANCFMQMHQPVDALDHFEQFLAESPNAPARQRREVEQQINQLRQQVAEVRVRVTPESASDTIVSVDGRATAMHGVVRMTPGHHVIEASADGFQTAHSELEATAGMRTELPLALHARVAASVAPAVAPDVPLPAASHPAPALTVTTTTVAPVPTGPTPEQPPRPVVAEHRGWSPVVFTVGAIATGIGVAGMTVFGVIALGADGTFKDAVTHIRNGDDPTVWMPRGQDAASQARTMAHVADGFLIGAVLAAGFTVVALTQTNWGHDAVVTPTVTANSAGLQFVARF